MNADQTPRAFDSATPPEPADGAVHPRRSAEPASWGAASDVTPAPAAAPVPNAPSVTVLPGVPLAGQTYPHTLRTATARWWKPIVGILGGALTAVVLMLAIGFGAVGYEMWAGDFDLARGMTMSPLIYAASLGPLALLWPITWFLVRFLHGQPFGYTGSVEGRFRWSWLLRIAGVLLVVFLVYMVLFMNFTPTTGRRESNWVWYAVWSVLLMPFQASAEEVFFRGYVQRSVGSWFDAERVAFVVGTLVSALLFMAAHGAGDPWLNLYYFSFGVTLSIAARLSGGLEIPIALHVVNNITSGVIGAYTMDMDSAFDRSAGVGGPFMLIQIVFVAVCVAGCLWAARRAGLRSRVAVDASDPATRG